MSSYAYWVSYLKAKLREYITLEEGGGYVCKYVFKLVFNVNPFSIQFDVSMILAKEIYIVDRFLLILNIYHR